MPAFLTRASESLRIVWAIAAKDLSDALRNRSTLTVVLTAILLAAMYKGLPILGRGNPTDVFVYDAGQSRLVTELEGDARFRVRRAESIEDLRELVTGADEGELGLAIPAGFDEAVQSGAQPEVTGYLAWAHRFAASRVASRFEQWLSELEGRPVHIQVDGNPVYPRPEGQSYATQVVAAGATALVFYLGMFLVPHLMFEEKRSKTLAALLVSPASAGQVVAGKALAGLFYGLVGAGAMLALNLPFVVHWGLTILGIAAGALCAVSLGLLMGSLLEAPQQMTIWGLVAANLLLVPPFLLVLEDILPAAVRAVLPWLPGVALATILRLSFSEPVPPVQLAQSVAVLVAGTGLALAGVAWRLRRSDS
jgi:ABC-type Na+ efflux pump permease subunit